MPRALCGHYDFSASRKVFLPAPGSGAWLGVLPALISKGVIPAGLLQGLSYPGLREDPALGRKSLFSIP